MLTLLLILAIIVGILLIAVVLIQNPKGSGLASNFSTGNQFFGVKKTTDIVEKITWATAGMVIVISLLSSSYLPKNNLKSSIPGGKDGKIDPQLEEIMQKGLPATTPTMPESSQDTESEEGPSFMVNPPEDAQGSGDQPELIMGEDGNIELHYPDGRIEKIENQ